MEKTYSSSAKKTFERIPPHNDDAEVALLGSVLLRNKVLEDVKSMIVTDEIRIPQDVKKRLDCELEVIRKAGMEHYILAFCSILNLANERHSLLFFDALDGEGSLVLFCLGITHRNPMKYGLGFASFLSMERLRIPWFNIICRKEDTRFIYSEMVKYFGEDKLGWIPDGIGILLNKTGLENAVPSIIYDHTSERTFLVHPEDLEKNGIVPVSLDLEKTLDYLVCLESLIKQNTPDFSLDSIQDDDSETFEMLSNGEAERIPLLNDNWIRKYLKKLKPNNIDELDALMSLYHNGPTDLIPMYIDAKRGLVVQDHQDLQEIEPLKRTYGIIVYKEQIIDVLTQTAFLSESEALCFCRALFLGDKGAVDRYERKIKDNMTRVFRNTHTADDLIDMIRAFSAESYKRKIGFWHTVLTYRLAFINCHYPDVFRQMMAIKLKQEFISVRKKGTFF